MKSAELSKDVFTVTAGFSLYLPGLSFILYAITFREDPRSICHTMAEDFKRTGTPAAYSLKKKANKPISQQFVDSLRKALKNVNEVEEQNDYDMYFIEKAIIENKNEMDKRLHRMEMELDEEDRKMKSEMIRMGERVAQLEKNKSKKPTE